VWLNGRKTFLPLTKGGQEGFLFVLFRQELEETDEPTVECGLPVNTLRSLFPLLSFQLSPVKVYAFFRFHRFRTDRAVISEVGLLLGQLAIALLVFFGSQIA
jgi:hypothetical protein